MLALGLEPGRHRLIIGTCEGDMVQHAAALGGFDGICVIEWIADRGAADVYGGPAFLVAEPRRFGHILADRRRYRLHPEAIDVKTHGLLDAARADVDMIDVADRHLRA